MGGGGGKVVKAPPPAEKWFFPQIEIRILGRPPGTKSLHCLSRLDNHNDISTAKSRHLL